MSEGFEGSYPEIKQLQGRIDQRLGLDVMPASRRFSATGGSLPASSRKVVDRILGHFDAQNLPRLLLESKRLSGGDGLVSDASVPAVWERTVIREALYKMRALQLVDADSINFGPSYSIPYSYRDTSAAGVNDTRTYEGQGIRRAGVIQTSENAYNLPQKLAFSVSDEMRHLTSASALRWDVVAENQANASRIIGEDTDRLLFNEMLRASDEFSATAVTDENLELQADDSKTIFVLAQWPVVRPRAVYDLQGTQVGNTTNPITVTYNAVELDEYDGSGTQAAGTYYVLNYNLGEIYLVDESGAVQTPANGTAYTISYSYTSNVYKFDTDLGSTEPDIHWDTFLYRYALRKATLEDDRYHEANFGLMSGTVMTQIEQAKQFGANAKRPGTDLELDGDLGRIKDVPNFKTAGPGLFFGDQRVLIGERGTTRFRLAKPWVMGALEDQRDANGRFTGVKEAFGDQFIVIHTPTQLKRAYTSIVLFSTLGRVAR